MQICKSLVEITRAQLYALCDSHVETFKALYSESFDEECEQHAACLAIDGDRAFEISQNTAEICSNYRYPFFLFGYSTMESGLITVCKQFSNDAAITTVVNWAREIAKNNGKLLRGTPRIPYFIEQNFSLTNVFNNSIHDLMKIRNCIAHANGQIDLMDRPQDVSDAIGRQSANGFAVADDCVSITDDGIDWSISQFHELLLNTRDALVQHKQVGTLICPP